MSLGAPANRRKTRKSDTGLSRRADRIRLSNQKEFCPEGALPSECSSRFPPGTGLFGIDFRHAVEFSRSGRAPRPRPFGRSSGQLLKPSGAARTGQIRSVWGSSLRATEILPRGEPVEDEVLVGWLAGSAACRPPTPSRAEGTVRERGGPVQIASSTVVFSQVRGVRERSGQPRMAPPTVRLPRRSTAKRPCSQSCSPTTRVDLRHPHVVQVGAALLDGPPRGRPRRHQTAVGSAGRPRWVTPRRRRRRTALRAARPPAWPAPGR